MKKTLLVMLSIFLVFSIGLAGAQDKAQNKERVKEKPKVIQRTGEVAAIDIAARSMTVKPLRYKEDIVVTINENTFVKMNKEKKTVADVKVGDVVTVWFFEKDKSVKSIDIKPPKPEQKAPEPAKPSPKK